MQIMNANEPSEETKNNWHNDPKNWIWGILHYNPKDKRIFPPKRTKQLGLTINFANPNSVLIFNCRASFVPSTSLRMTNRYV